MADLFARDTVIVLLIAAWAILIVTPIQLMLCFKAKKLFVKRLPLAIFAAITIIFYILAITARTWIAFIYLIIAAFSVVSLLFIGLAWIIWAFAKLFKKKNNS